MRKAKLIHNRCQKKRKKLKDTVNIRKPTKDEMKLDPIVYWVNAAHAFPQLSPVACDILSVPASSAPVQHTFSVSGEASRRKRNRLADHNLERETLIRKNRKYVLTNSFCYRIIRGGATSPVGQVFT